MLVAFSVAPAGGSSSDSVHDAVAAAVKVVRDSGLPNRTDAMFTTIEGDWDECMAVVRGAVEAVEAYGTRVSLVLKADIRPGHTGELTGKLDRLEQAISRLESPEGVNVDGDVVDAAEPVAVVHSPEIATTETLVTDAAEPVVEAPSARPAALLARFAATDPIVTVQGSGDDDLPIRVAEAARVIVSEGAPPEHIGLFPFGRATLRTEGTLQILSGSEQVWSGEAGETASVVVWADAVEEPAGVWIELAR